LRRRVDPSISPKARVLSWIYDRLIGTLGPQGWWPAKSRLEICVGVILTQHTAWTNVEKAIRRLKAARPLTVWSLLRQSPKRLAQLIRPAGSFNVKAKRLRAFLLYFQSRYGGNFKKMSRRGGASLRAELLGVHGLGPESVDAILLYAGQKPFFVIDSYTRRILSRHGMLEEGAPYHEAQDLLMDHLPHSVERFNEYHALLVEVGKRFCRRRPRCWECPLDPLPRTASGCRRFVAIREKAA